MGFLVSKVLKILFLFLSPADTSRVSMRRFMKVPNKILSSLTPCEPPCLHCPLISMPELRPFVASNKALAFFESPHQVRIPDQKDNNLCSPSAGSGTNTIFSTLQ